MKQRLAIILVTLMVFGLFVSCCGDNVGGEGQPCSEQGTCQEDWLCHHGLCVSPLTVDKNLYCVNGVCTDPTTGLEWQQEPTGETDMEWEFAIAHCQALSLDGDGWRVPNISELRSLIRNCVGTETGGACRAKDECSPCGVSSSDVCLEDSCWSFSCRPDSCPSGGGPTGCYWPDELGGTCDEWYWSSSPTEHGWGSSDAWFVWFDRAMVLNANGDFLSVRCVR